MNTEQKYVIIVAGGSGKRMGSDLPKQFLPVAGKPILMHTIEKFYAFDSSIYIILVLPEAQIEFWNTLIKEYKFTIKHQLEAGGTERFYSVKNGLKHITLEGLVAVHDGVRPLVSNSTIKNCFDNALEHDAAIPVIAATESIRKVNSTSSIAVNRAEYYMVQTPQVFKSELLLEAYQQEFNSHFTDDASVVENQGGKIYLTEGNAENIKITRPMDIKIAEVLLKDY